MSTSKNTEKIFFLEMFFFFSEESLSKHVEYCKNHETVKIKTPEKGSILDFKNHKHSIRVPITVYADLECSTKTRFKFMNQIQKKVTRKIIKSVNLRVSIIILFVMGKSLNLFCIAY